MTPEHALLQMAWEWCATVAVDFYGDLPCQEPDPTSDPHLKGETREYEMDRKQLTVP